MFLDPFSSKYFRSKGNICELLANFCPILVSKHQNLISLSIFTTKAPCAERVQCTLLPKISLSAVTKGWHLNQSYWFGKRPIFCLSILFHYPAVQLIGWSTICHRFQKTSVDDICVIGLKDTSVCKNSSRDVNKFKKWRLLLVYHIRWCIFLKANQKKTKKRKEDCF